MIDPALAGVPSWWTGVTNAMRGIPIPVWLAIAWNESKLDPTAHNTGTPTHPEDSVGLFQANRRGGQGAGYSVEALKDPVLNAQVASGAIRQAIAICGPNDIVCIARNSGHPGYIDPSDPRIQAIATTYRQISILDPIAAVQQLLAGIHLPTPDPGEEGGGGTVGGAIGGGLGSGIASGLVDAVRNSFYGFFTGFTTMAKDDLIEKYSAPAVAILGLSCLSWGVTLAALNSGPGRAALSVATIAAGPEFSLATGAAQAASSDTAPAETAETPVAARPAKKTKSVGRARVKAGVRVLRAVT